MQVLGGVSSKIKAGIFVLRILDNIREEWENQIFVASPRASRENPKRIPLPESQIKGRKTDSDWVNNLTRKLAQLGGRNE